MLLLDHSAWARRHKPPVKERFAAVLKERLFAACLPFMLEAGVSARSGKEHDTVRRDFTQLRCVPITLSVERLALDAQSDLARIGHHRMSPADIIIAACAHEARGGVLHYDRDYDVLREHTRLRFRSEWLAPAGSLD